LITFTLSLKRTLRVLFDMVEWPASPLLRSGILKFMVVKVLRSSWPAPPDARELREQGLASD
jgi:hypothetical protein